MSAFGGLSSFHYRAWMFGAVDGGVDGMMEDQIAWSWRERTIRTLFLFVVSAGFIVGVFTGLGPAALASKGRDGVEHKGGAASAVFFGVEQHNGTWAPILVGASITALPGAVGSGRAHQVPQTYQVSAGDTLFGIAKHFGLRAETVFDANPTLSSAAYLRVGTELTIPPGDGVLHRVRSGETLEGIAKNYAVAPQDIRLAAGAALSHELTTGTFLLVEGAKPRRTLLPAAVLALPALPGYFIVPATGHNWGRLHGNNGVDIANACGSQVVAAAGGTVLRAVNSGWNQGAGRYILIQHPNATQTFYGHLSELLVTTGQSIAQGSSIGLVGNTGLTRGVTGCHLHYEVRGARNPLARR